MNKYQKWKHKGFDYHTGVTLYCSHPKCNANLLRLFRKKESTSSLQKLKYELRKLFRSETKTTTVSAKQIHVGKSKPQISKTPIEKPTKAYLENLPEPVRKKRVEAYKIWIDNCELKSKLNSLPSRATKQAFDIQMQIWLNLESQRVLWEHVNYYQMNKQILPEVNNEFSSLSPAKLLKTYQYRHQTKSKAQKAILIYEKDIAECEDLSKKNRMIRALEKNKKKLIQVEWDLVEINKIIHKQ